MLIGKKESNKQFNNRYIRNPDIMLTIRKRIQFKIFFFLGSKLSARLVRKANVIISRTWVQRIVWLVSAKLIKVTVLDSNVTNGRFV